MSGRIYEEEHLPGVADYDPRGRMRLDAIARLLQDVAYRDLIESGAERDGTWIVRRVRITAGPFPRFGERIAVKTYCSGLGRFSAERTTEVAGADGGRVTAVALWAFIDPEAGRPLRLDPEVVSLWKPTAGDRGAKVRLHHPEPPADAVSSDWEFRATDLDIVGHVNNSNYWVPFEEDLMMTAAPPLRVRGREGVEEISGIEAEIEFHSPAPAGVARILRSPAGMWIGEPAHAPSLFPVYASILVSPDRR